MIQILQRRAGLAQTFLFQACAAWSLCRPPVEPIHPPYRPSSGAWKGTWNLTTTTDPETLPSLALRDSRACSLSRGMDSARRADLRRNVCVSPLIFILDASLRFNDLINRWPDSPVTQSSDHRSCDLL